MIVMPHNSCSLSLSLSTLPLQPNSGRLQRPPSQESWLEAAHGIFRKKNKYWPSAAQGMCFCSSSAARRQQICCVLVYLVYASSRTAFFTPAQSKRWLQIGISRRSSCMVLLYFAQWIHVHRSVACSLVFKLRYTLIILVHGFLMGQQQWWND